MDPDDFDYTVEYIEDNDIAVDPGESEYSEEDSHTYSDYGKDRSYGVCSNYSSGYWDHYGSY